MSDVLPEEVRALAEAVGPEPDELVEEMDTRAEREGFPTVGPAVGGWLALLARVVDARRVFEFGSGFGYSAYWFARELPADGEVVLTEVDRDDFERAGLADRARFEHGDAVETVTGYEGPFDVVLVDNEKSRYVEAFEAVRGKVREGGLVLADNAVTAGPIDRTDVLALLGGESVDASEVSEASRGIADYLGHVRDVEGFETALLPLGEGVAVSVRRG